MRSLSAVLCLLVTASVVHADDDVGLFGGFAFQTNWNKYETSSETMRFTSGRVGFDLMAILPMAYARISWDLFNALGFESEGTTTDKVTGTVMPQTGRYSADRFFFILPRLEGGIALGKKVLHPTLGLVLQDSMLFKSSNTASESAEFYTIDLGIALGLALMVGESSKFVIHPTVRFWGSLYDEQTRFFDGGGGSFDVLAGAMIGRISVSIRAGADGHNLHGNKFTRTGLEETVHQGSKYLSFGIGYVPVD